MKAGIGAAVLGSIGIVAYLQHPLFGKLPSGERLARIERSPHYANGALGSDRVFFICRETAEQATA